VTASVGGLLIVLAGTVELPRITTADAPTDPLLNVGTTATFGEVGVTPQLARVIQQIALPAGIEPATCGLGSVQLNCPC